jgi:hypothetical protein
VNLFRVYSRASAPFVTKWLHCSGGKELALEFRAETGFCAPARALSTCRNATWPAYRNTLLPLSIINIITTIPTAVAFTATKTLDSFRIDRFFIFYFIFTCYITYTWLFIEVSWFIQTNNQWLMIRLWLTL